MTQQEYIDSLIERETHGSTMLALTVLERQHLNDWRAHFEQRATIERSK